MRTAVQLLKHRPDGDIGISESRDEREKAMRWRRKEATIEALLFYVSLSATLCFGASGAIVICAFLCSVMLCARIHEWIPSEKVARLNRCRPTRVLTNNGARDLVLWMNYDPPNFMHKRLKFFGTVSGATQASFGLLLIVSFAQYGFIALCAALLVALVFGYYINFAIDKNERICRVNLLLTKDGIGLDYSSVGISTEVPPISWDKIESVTFAKTTGLFNEHRLLQFRLSMRDWPQQCTNLLENCPGNLFIEDEGMEQKLVLNFRADGFASAIHRRDLIAYIAATLPAEKIIGRHSDYSNHSTNLAHECTYTELWMNSLTASSSRLRKTDLPPQTTLKRRTYTILEQLGAGGQGVAYAAMDNERAKKVVLKEFILPTNTASKAYERALEHVLVEASLLKQLNHPQIVQYVDNFIEDQRAYLVTEHIEGLNLRRFVQKNGPFDEPLTLSLAIQMCDILSYLHQLPMPVIHRDFTPDNLMYTSNGKVKLLDFNVAQQLDLVNSRTVVGKHAYLPPEQFRGKATIQSDIYALGATMFFLLTGEDPEPISTSHPLLKTKSVSAQLDAIVAKATETSQDNRYMETSLLKAELNLLVIAGHPQVR